MKYDSNPPSVDAILKDQVYLGNLSAAQSQETKKKLGITHILSVCPEYSSTGVNHLVIAVDDSEYDDLLIHLPQACRFIEDALSHGGRVLVHCVMGVSRSTTARFRAKYMLISLCTLVMKTRSLTTSAAISFIKQHRPWVQPNYGFIKQLDTFLECGCEPTVTHPAYISWKRKQKQDVTNFLNQLIDTTVIIPDQLLLSSEFPSESDQAESMVSDLGVTHMLSLSPAEVVSASVHHRHINIAAHSPDELLLVLPEACGFIQEALNAGGRVLVHSLLEARACTVVGAHLIFSRKISPQEASDVIQHALPLFDPTRNFTRDLELFHACKYKPVPGHPAITTHCGPPSVSWNLASPDAKLRADAILSTAASVMSETGIDMRAFGDALIAIQQKAGPGIVKTS
ncbi:protein-tyrosine phosphatase-like protein [Mycena sp. CBHHK59/15]|nr:protein-tyrosine phosphatase-like protein [Mycena sp. CBHHK59/15]